MIDELTDHKQTQRAMWAAGDYAAFAPLVAEVGERLVARVGIAPGATVLDVACGTGNVAIPAALAGARVTGVDLTPEHFPAARARAAAAGVEVDWVEGDVEALPFEDDTLRPRAVLVRLHVRAAPRASRRPSWRGCCARRAGSASARSRPTAPAATSSRRSARSHRRRRPSRRTRSTGASRRTCARCSATSTCASSGGRTRERFASLDAAVELYTTTFGPVVALGGPALAGDLRALFARHAVDGGTAIPYDYLVTLSVAT